MSQVSQDALLKNELEAEQIDWVVPHQANLRISQFIQKKFELSDNQVFSKILFMALKFKSMRFRWLG